MPRSSSRSSQRVTASPVEKPATRRSIQAVASPSAKKAKTSPASKTKSTPSSGSAGRGHAASKSEPSTSSLAAKTPPASRSRSRAPKKMTPAASAAATPAKSPATSRSRSRASAEKPAAQKKTPAVKASPAARSRSRGSAKSTPASAAKSKSQAVTKARGSSRGMAVPSTHATSSKKMQSPSPKKASVKKAKESTRETPQRGRSATRRGKQEDKHDEDEKADVDEEDETKQEAGEKSDAENLEVKTAVSETDAVDGGHVGSETAEPTEQSETSKDDTADSAVDEKVEEGKKTEGTSQPKEGPEVDTMEKMEVEVGSCGTGQKRKREDEEDGETGVEAKVMKVSDESNGLDKESAMDVKQAEVPAGVEAVSTDVAGGATESSELDADLLDSEYIVISTDDVPAADSDEMAQVASKMAVAVEPTTTAVTTDGLCSSANGENCSGDEDPILSRTFVVNPAVSESVAVGTSQSFSLVSYNVLADCHAQKDYAGDRAPWITDEQLVMASRHKRILEELIYLDADVICLQEVAGDYLSDLLQPALESRGYKGVFIPRNTKQYCEGEATFYRTNRFTLVSSEGLLLGDLIGAAIDESSGLEADKKELVKNSLSTHAVAMLTRLKSVDADDCVTIANIHVVYDKLERQDRQCLQIATAVQKLIELAGGVDKSHIICGDFNSWPGTPPYQLMTDGSLNETSLIALQGIESIDAGEEQFLPVVNLWSDGFQFPIGGDLKSAYLTVLGEEPLTSRYAADARVLPLDYIWFSSVSLDVLGVLKVVDRELIESGIPTAVFPSDHLSIKARFAFK